VLYGHAFSKRPIVNEQPPPTAKEEERGAPNPLGYPEGPRGQESMPWVLKM
jgi:hypothetical protein